MIVPRYLVVLERLRAGAAAGTTRDVIEAADAADAEQQAVEGWQQAAPAFTYRPLLTTAVSTG